MMKEKVTVFGSFAVDLMARTPHLPVSGETVKGSMFKMGPGGKGFNQCVAAKKAGANVTMITKLGRDTFANVALDTMTALDIPKDHIMFSEDVSTATALIMVDETTSQNEIVVTLGACETISKEDIEKVKNEIIESDYLLVQLEVNIDAVENVVKIAHENGVKVILNTAPARPIDEALFSMIDIITPNEVEAEILTGVHISDETKAQEACNIFFEKGVKNVVITLGSRGVFVATPDESKFIPAFKVNAIDTTGAGDAFNGGFCTALAEGKSIWEAAKFGNALAALSVTRLGTTTSMPTREEIDVLIKEIVD